MLDIEGLTLTPADRDLLREPAVGGVILFTRNYESPAQLADLVAAIRAVRSPPLLIAADHEGGRVQRFREGFTAVPPMRQIGRQYDSDPGAAASLARTAGWVVASELRAMDIDLSFTPCVDGRGACRSILSGIKRGRLGCGRQTLSGTWRRRPRFT